MSEFRYTVALPPGATGGKWTLTPQAQHPVGSLIVALPYSGDISAEGVLVSNGAAPDLPASVPGEDVASPEYLLELSYAKGGRQVPGVPVRLRMVETEPGIVDVGQLLREGRALAVTPEQLASLNTAAEAAQAIVTEGRQVLADTAQSAALAVSAAGIEPVASLAAVPDQVGLYRTMDTGYVYERVSGVANPQRRKSLEAAPLGDLETLRASTTTVAVAQSAADLPDALARMLTVGEGEIPAEADWTLTQRLVIDAQGKRIKFRNKGRLHFDVRDYNGGAMIQVINPAPGSEIDLGYWDHVGLPAPSYEIMNRTAPAPGGTWGGAHWRSDSDHGAEIVNAVGCTIRVNIGSARAMGLVFNGGHSNHVYGVIRNTLADATHLHDGSHNIHWHGVRVENAGDDAFPVVPKPGEPLPHDIHYWGCVAEGGFGRGFVHAGGERVFWHACTARDTYKEGFLALEDAHYESGAPVGNYAEDCTAIGCGQRDTSQAGESQPGGFRVGYEHGLGEDNVRWTRCRSIGNRGSGFWTAGKRVNLTDCESAGNGVEDAFYSTDLTIRGGEYQQSKLDTAYYRLLDLPRWRKRGSAAPYALKIVGDNVGRIEGDFGTEWAFPLATDGTLTQTDLRGSVGVGNRALPGGGYYGLTPALPESGTGITNTTPFDVQVMIQGGVLDGTNLTPPGGSAVGIGSTRAFMLPRGWTVALYYGTAPERWVWAATQ